MKPISFFFIVLGTVDLIGGLVVLVALWVVHRRNRRAAVAAGLPVPDAATGSFVFVGLAVLFGVLLLYGVAVLVSLE
jgi:hypothetical protein